MTLAKSMFMRKLTCFYLLLVTLSAFADGDGLLGVWKSNKPGTLAYLQSHTHLTDQQLDLVAQTLGKTTFTFDKTNMTISADNWKFASPYKIVSKTPNSITFEAKDPSTQIMGTNVFEFYGNHFWSSDDRIPGYKERFDKLVQQ
jgi:hypothetical protein